jgi:hypothetical protein
MANFIRARLKLCESQFKIETASALLLRGPPVERLRSFSFNLPPGRLQLTIRGMFDTISAELAAATDKLAHLRRFL